MCERLGAPANRTRKSPRGWGALLPLPAMLLVAASCLCACQLPDRHPAVMPARGEVPLAGTATASLPWPEQQWWRQLGDAQLDTLIELALANAPDLQQAQARVELALRTTEQQRAELGVKLDALANAARTGVPKNFSLPGSAPEPNQPPPPSVTALGLAGLRFQYDFDWWGQRRAAVRSALDRARASAAEHAASALLLQNAVANSYCGWLADQQRLRIARDLVALAQSTLHITQLRRGNGLDSAQTEHDARIQLAQARLQLDALSGSAQMHKVELAALIGVAPTQLPMLRPRPLPRFDTALPADAGLALLGRRPDIAASRWRIEAAGEDVEQARTAYLPDISISALAVFISSDFKTLFHRDSVLWNVGPALTLPVFESGRIRARYGVSRAQLDGAIADYNLTVVGAARDVGTQVALLQQLSGQRAQQHLAVTESGALQARNDRLAQQGLTDRRERNAVRAQTLRERDTALQLDAQWLGAQLALIKALGGGYQSDAAATAQRGRDD